VIYGIGVTERLKQLVKLFTEFFVRASGKCLLLFSKTKVLDATADPVMKLCPKVIDNVLKRPVLEGILRSDGQDSDVKNRSN
jgi:hypothetical protein